MKLLLMMTMSLLSLSVFAQRYSTNVIEKVVYEVIEETNEDVGSIRNDRSLNYRTVRVTDHLKKENGILKVDFTWKSYYYEIDKDVFKFPKGAVKATRLRDFVISDHSCETDEDGNAYGRLVVTIQSKTLDPEKYDQDGALFLTKTKNGSIKIDTKKYCNANMPRSVIIKTL